MLDSKYLGNPEEQFVFLLKLEKKQDQNFK